MARSKLIELVLSSTMINGQEAFAEGIVDACVPTADIDRTAIDFLHSLVRGRPPLLVRSVMQSIHNSRLMAREDALREESRLFCGLAAGSIP
jgi:enoyl-CoA hydratase/carnithine racemase